MLTRRASSITRFAVATALLFAALSGAPQARAGEAVAAVDPLAAVNKAFLEIYGARRADFLKRAGPIIIVKFDAAVLIHRGGWREEIFTPQIYHGVKSVSHTVLATVATLMGKSDGPLDAETRARLTRLRGLIPAAQDDLPERGWPTGVTASHRTMLSATGAFIDATLKADETDEAALIAFARAMQSYVLVSGRVAAEAQLDGLHALMTRWRHALGADWAKTWVVNLTPRQARRGNLQHAYLQRLMGKPAAAARLITAENIFDETGALRLLGTIVIDRAASNVFFGDPTRLERDFLSDAAAAYIAKIFSRRRRRR